MAGKLDTRKGMTQVQTPRKSHVACDCLGFVNMTSLTLNGGGDTCRRQKKL